MVHPAGFEPTTFYSGGRRSIQLSYGCPYHILYNIVPNNAKGKRLCKKNTVFYPVSPTVDNNALMVYRKIFKCNTAGKIVCRIKYAAIMKIQNNIRILQLSHLYYLKITLPIAIL